VRSRPVGRDLLFVAKANIVRLLVLVAGGCRLCGGIELQDVALRSVRNAPQPSNSTVDEDGCWSLDFEMQGLPRDLRATWNARSIALGTQLWNAEVCSESLYLGSVGLLRCGLSVSVET
jgi:hypothetical protein